MSAHAMLNRGRAWCNLRYDYHLQAQGGHTHLLDRNMITLREYADSDLERLVQLANSENVSRYLVYTFPYPYTLADADWWIGAGSKKNDGIARVIEYQGVFVGNIGIRPQNGWREHLGEIGYWVGEDYWGKGIATAALLQMTEYGFNTRHFRKLYATALAPNIASMRVLEKCGYRREGILKVEVHKKGTYFDIHHFARHR
jgi:RimJ/RimL family protein N-acetyltransferase